MPAEAGIRSQGPLWLGESQAMGPSSLRGLPDRPVSARCANPDQEYSTRIDGRSRLPQSLTQQGIAQQTNDSGSECSLTARLRDKSGQAIAHQTAVLPNILCRHRHAGRQQIE